MRSLERNAVHENSCRSCREKVETKYIVLVSVTIFGQNEMKGIFVPGSLGLEQGASAGIVTSAYLSMFRFENKPLWNVGRGTWLSVLLDRAVGLLIFQKRSHESVE
jgi:hypothetical protein